MGHGRDLMARGARSARSVVSQVLVTDETGIPPHGHPSVRVRPMTSGAGAALRVDRDRMGRLGRLLVAGGTVSLRLVMVAMAVRARPARLHLRSLRVTRGACESGVLPVIEGELTCACPFPDLQMHRNRARPLAHGTVTALAPAVDDRSRVVALGALASGLEGNLSVGSLHRVTARAFEVTVSPMIEPPLLALAGGEVAAHRTRRLPGPLHHVLLDHGGIQAA